MLENHDPVGASRRVLIAHGRPKRHAPRNASISGSLLPVIERGCGDNARLAAGKGLGDSEAAHVITQTRDRQGVPEAWPALLSREQLCAYVGMSWATISKVCPVAPVDLGSSLLRYSRQKIDEWVSNLPPRQQKPSPRPAGGGPTAEPDELELTTDCRMDSLDRVRARLVKP